MDSIEPVGSVPLHANNNWYEDAEYKKGLMESVQSLGSQMNQSHKQAQENTRREAEALGFSGESTISSF